MSSHTHDCKHYADSIGRCMLCGNDVPAAGVKGRPAINREAIAEWRALQGRGMTSAVGEYTPAEFWTLLDAYEALADGVKACRGGPGECAHNGACMYACGGAVPVRCKDCDVPNGCPEFCRCAPGVAAGRSMARINLPCVVGQEGEPACIAGTEGCKVEHTVERFAPGVAPSDGGQRDA